MKSQDIRNKKFVTRYQVLLGAIVFALFLAPNAMAQTDAPPASLSTDAHPWVQAKAVLTATQNDFSQNGIQSVANHVNDLEQALANGDKAFTASDPGDGPVVVLADGPAESLIVTAMAGKIAETTKRQVETIANPYPLIGLYLGSYYNEIGRNDDAVRVLDRAIKLSAAPEMRLGQTLPLLLSERGAALAQLRRWDDALADYDDGLKIETMADESRARLYRGRGYALTELNRLDEAEQAYNESLKLAPGNPLATHELQYIAKLKAGAPRSPPGNLTLPAPQKPQ